MISPEWQTYPPHTCSLWQIHCCNQYYVARVTSYTDATIYIQTQTYTSCTWCVAWLTALNASAWKWNRCCLKVIVKSIKNNINSHMLNLKRYPKCNDGTWLGNNSYFLNLKVTSTLPEWVMWWEGFAFHSGKINSWSFFGQYMKFICQYLHCASYVIMPLLELPAIMQTDRMMGLWHLLQMTQTPQNHI